MSNVMSDAGAARKDIYMPEAATLVNVVPMTGMESFFAFKLDSGRELGHMPGQFAEISIPGIGEAPISISSSPTRKGVFQMGVRRMGNVTNHLHKLQIGDKVGIRGPFGTHFPVDTVMKGKDIVFIAGGIGLVPLRSAINYVLDNRKDYGDVSILFGCKAPAERLFVRELADWRAREDVTFDETVDACDDESWQGKTGVITTLMQGPVFDAKSTMQVSKEVSGELMPALKIADPKNTIALICGPPVMYKFVLLELKELEVQPENTYVSLERHMKCGVGKCGHCQINRYYVCQDGPVFKFSDIIDVREAIR